jgi:hypothetical protein
MNECPGCAPIRDLLPELATGVAAGDDRASALAHLNICVECRRQLDALSAVADELLTLMPGVEPPGGFESTVLARVAPPRRRWRRVGRLVTAVAVAAAIGAGAGTAATTEASVDDRRIATSYRKTLQTADGRYLTARRLTDPDSSSPGVVFAYQGKPSWVFVVVRYGATGGPYQVHLITQDGRDQLIGEIGVTGGKCSWGATIDVDVAQIAEVRLSGAEPPLTAVFH